MCIVSFVRDGKTSDEKARVREEFTRTARSFAERTAGRFDHMGVVDFSRITPGVTVLEVGAGTGNFLSLFEPFASRLIAADITPAMLGIARERNPRVIAVVCAGERLAFRGSSVDLATSAQMLHHTRDPVPIIKEMARVARNHVLVVDQVVPAESQDMADALTELEVVRDPTHARSRTPSEMRNLLTESGLEVIEEKTFVTKDRLNNWMSPGEFPHDRIEDVRKFIEKRGDETGMNFRDEGGDIVYERSRMMLLAKQ